MHTGSEIFSGVCGLKQEVLSKLCYDCQAVEHFQQQGDEVPVRSARGDILSVNRSTSTHLP